MNDQYKPYQNLANAIILQAIDDVITWRIACKTGRIGRYIEQDGKSALAFLMDDSRLQQLTSFSSDEIMSFLEIRLNNLETGKFKHKNHRKVRSA